MTALSILSLLVCLIPDASPPSAARGNRLHVLQGERIARVVHRIVSGAATGCGRTGERNRERGCRGDQVIGRRREQDMNVIAVWDAESGEASTGRSIFRSLDDADRFLE